MKKTFIPITNTEILITRLLAAKLITSKQQQKIFIWINKPPASIMKFLKLT